MTPLETVLDRLEKVKRNGAGWSAACPAHEDSNPSLSVTEGSDGTVLVKCHAGCATGAVVNAVGLDLGDLFPPKLDAKPEIVDTYDYVDETGTLLFQVVRMVPKTFRQRRPGGPGEERWVWNLKGTRRVLYRLPDVLLQPEHVFVVEGEKDADALTAKGLTATTNPGGAGKWRDEYVRSLRHLARVTVVADRDEPGRDHARAVAASLRADGALEVAVVEPPDGCKDISDMLAQGLSRDDLVPMTASAGSSVDPPPRRRAEPLAAVVADVEDFIRRFVVLPTPAQYPFLALWVAHTWAVSAVDTTPYVHVTAPEKRSGKTRLLEVLAMVVRQPMHAADISPAALYRQVHKYQPTVLLDEVDGLFGKGGRDPEHRDLIRLLNAGWQRGAKVYRMGGPKGTEAEEFEAFCPKVLAGIGDLPDTLADRSVRIDIKRRARGEPVERLRRRDVAPVAQDLRERLGAAVEPHLGALASARPDEITQLDDRAVDAWEPILAIAELAGPEWSGRARLAAVALSSNREPEDDTAGVRLLADIKTVLGDRDRISTAQLLVGLAALPESPWGDWYGKPLTDRTLARMLKPYGPRSKSVRLDDGTIPRGYLRESFIDPFTRYVDPPDATSATSQAPQGFQPISQAPPTAPVADAESVANPRDIRNVALVASTGADKAPEPVCEVCDNTRGRPETVSTVRGVSAHPGCVPKLRTEPTPEEIAR